MLSVSSHGIFCPWSHGSRVLRWVLMTRGSGKKPEKRSASWGLSSVGPSFGAASNTVRGSLGLET